MRFGAFVPQGWRLDLAGIEVERHWAAMYDVVTTIESAGFESAWVYDHFHTVPVPTQEPTYEAWALMAAFAAATERVRLGQMCTCNEYRPPAYLAKAAACIDQISGGRLEMGIGAGWYEHEFLGYGYSFEKPAIRIGRLGEAVEIMKALWTEDVVDYEGKHYRLQGAISQPKPAQRPHIPLWIAGGGEQLTLRIAARHAAYSNFGNQPIETFVHKSEVLADHCRTVGRDFDEIVRSTSINVLIAATEDEVEERRRWYLGHIGQFVPAERAERMLAALFGESGGISGTPEQVVAYLERWSGVGCSYAICNFPDAAYDPAGLELFGREVIPALS